MFISLRVKKYEQKEKLKGLGKDDGQSGVYFKLQSQQMENIENLHLPWELMKIC